MTDRNLAEHMGKPDLILLPSDRNGQKKETEPGSLTQVRQKHKNRILLDVYWSGRCLHVSLANRQALSASGLNATIKKLNDVEEKPLQESRVGKFKFYSLTEEGMDYVEREILPLFSDSDRDKEEAHGLFTLLAAYKDENQGGWTKELMGLLEKEGAQEAGDHAGGSLGHGFLKEYAGFYRRAEKRAENLLDLLVADKELRQRISGYIETRYTGNIGTVMEALNLWAEQDYEEICRLADRLFDGIYEGRSGRQRPDTSLEDAQDWLEAVQDRLLADAMRALGCGWKKEDLARAWMDADMEKHLALYLAEKYRVLRRHIMQER